MTKINPQRIYGNFVSGVALDVHTLSSTYMGVNEYGHEVYDTARSEVGDLLYRLKYRSDRDAGNEIARVAAVYIAGSRTKFDVLVPVPPSGVRALQPVIYVANAIGSAVPLPVADCVTTTRATEQLKGVTDRERRKELLAGLHAIDASKTEGRHPAVRRPVPIWFDAERHHRPHDGRRTRPKRSGPGDHQDAE